VPNHPVSHTFSGFETPIERIVSGVLQIGDCPQALHKYFKY